MKRIVLRRLGVVSTLALVSVWLVAAAQAGNSKGRGGSNGNGEEAIRPARITFNDGGTQLASDGRGAYEHGIDGVEAFIGSQANTGNVWLRTVAAPSRGVWLDFSLCESVDPADCTPLFTSAVNGGVSIKVDADAILSRGIYDMAVGSLIHPPMRVYYTDDADQVRFVDFDNAAKGGSPCKNQGVVNVEVERTGNTTWVVRAPGLASPSRPTACANSPLRDDPFQGLYWMGFEFTVEELP